jgi:Ca2+-binding EF-hand superfamily protein
MKRHLWVFGLIALCGLTMGPASRAEEETEAERMKRLDLNADGRVDETEMRTEIKRITFVSVDANGDGFIVVEEWVAADQKEGAEKRFASIDTNKDGKIDQMELSDFIDQEFAQKRMMENMDVDRSGYLTSDEVSRKPSFNLFGIRF